MEEGKGILIYPTALWEKQQECSCYSWVNLVLLLFPAGLITKWKSASFYGNCYNEVIVTSRVCHQNQPDNGKQRNQISNRQLALMSTCAGVDLHTRRVQPRPTACEVMHGFSRSLSTHHVLKMMHSWSPWPQLKEKEGKKKKGTYLMTAPISSYWFSSSFGPQIWFCSSKRRHLIICSITKSKTRLPMHLLEWERFCLSHFCLLFQVPQQGWYFWSYFLWKCFK